VVFLIEYVWIASQPGLPPTLYPKSLYVLRCGTQNQEAKPYDSAILLQLRWAQVSFGNLSKTHFSESEQHANNTMKIRQWHHFFLFFDSVTPSPPQNMWWEYITTYTMLNVFVVARSTSESVFLFLFICTVSICYFAVFVACCSQLCHYNLSQIPNPQSSYDIATFIMLLSYNLVVIKQWWVHQNKFVF
jgi:hypothetical protein